MCPIMYVCDTTSNIFSKQNKLITVKGIKDSIVVKHNGKTIVYSCSCSVVLGIVIRNIYTENIWYKMLERGVDDKSLYYFDRYTNSVHYFGPRGLTHFGSNTEIGFKIRI